MVALQLLLRFFLDTWCDASRGAIYTTYMNIILQVFTPLTLHKHAWDKYWTWFKSGPKGPDLGQQP